MEFSPQLAASTISSVGDTLGPGRWEPSRAERILAARLRPFLDAPPYRIAGMLDQMIEVLGRDLGEGHGLRLAMGALTLTLDGYIDDLGQPMTPEHRDVVRAGRALLDRVIGDEQGGVPADIAEEVRMGRRQDLRALLLFINSDVYHARGRDRERLEAELGRVTQELSSLFEGDDL